MSDMRLTGNLPQGCDAKLGNAVASAAGLRGVPVSAVHVYESPNTGGYLHPQFGSQEPKFSISSATIDGLNDRQLTAFIARQLSPVEVPITTGLLRTASGACAVYGLIATAIPVYAVVSHQARSILDAALMFGVGVATVVAAPFLWRRSSRRVRVACYAADRETVDLLGGHEALAQAIELSSPEPIERVGRMRKLFTPFHEAPTRAARAQRIRAYGASLG